MSLWFERPTEPHIDVCHAVISAILFPITNYIDMLNHHMILTSQCVHFYLTWDVNTRLIYKLHRFEDRFVIQPAVKFLQNLQKKKNYFVKKNFSIASFLLSLFIFGCGIWLKPPTSNNSNVKIIRIQFLRIHFSKTHQTRIREEQQNIYKRI